MDFTYLKNFMDRVVKDMAPGNTVSVYHKNKEVFRYSAGYSDLESKTPMTGDELLYIWSCSKPATVTAALQLYEQGYFLLTDPLYDFIPEFKDMYVQDADGNVTKAKNPITMRHLFTMTSGLDYDTKAELFQKAKIETNGRMPTVEVIRRLASKPLCFEPGTHWKYSLSHDVLAAVVEVISGKRFQDYMKENVFGPIGITDVHYHYNEEIGKRMASEYVDQTEEGITDIVKAQMCGGKRGVWVNAHKENDLRLGPDYDSGGGGVIVSVPDYAKFASCLACGGVAPNGERLLSPGTIDLMRTNQLNEVQRSEYAVYQHTGYGYGLGVRTVYDRALSGFNGTLGEFGWGGAAGATISCDPENQFSYFYAHHMLNPHEEFYQPRLRNIAYACLFR